MRNYVDNGLTIFVQCDTFYKFMFLSFKIIDKIFILLPVRIYIISNNKCNVILLYEGQI